MRQRLARRLRWAVVLVAVAIGDSAVACKKGSKPFDVELGRTTYLANCAACHGNEGGGDGPAAEMVLANHGVQPPSLGPDGPAARRSREWLGEIINKGGRHMGLSDMMPAWGSYLDRQSIDAVADYVLLMSADIEIPKEEYEEIEAFMGAPEGADPRGRRLFVHHCASCHGPQGRGDGAVFERPGGVVRPRDLTNTEYFSKKSDDDIYTAIALGGKHAGESALMPGWMYEFESYEIGLLVDYIRVISKTTDLE